MTLDEPTEDEQTFVGKFRTHNDKGEFWHGHDVIPSLPPSPAKKCERAAINTREEKVTALCGGREGGKAEAEPD